MTPPLILAAMVASTAISAASSIQQGRAAGRAASAQAEEAVRGAAERERQFRERGRLAMGTQAAGFAASGVRLGSGSPLALELESAREIETGALEIRRGGAAEAAFARFGGRQARQAGTIGAVTSLLRGGAQAGAFALTPKAQGGMGMGS